MAVTSSYFTGKRDIIHDKVIILAIASKIYQTGTYPGIIPICLVVIISALECIFICIGVLMILTYRYLL